MTVEELVFAQAKVLAGELEKNQEAMLKLLCAMAASSMAARLRKGLRPEDCKAEFVAAASLLALAALGGASDDKEIQEFQAGDLTVKRGGIGKDAASRCLRTQAEILMGPFLQDRFSFAGV